MLEQEAPRAPESSSNPLDINIQRIFSTPEGNGRSFLKRFSSRSAEMIEEEAGHPFESAHEIIQEVGKQDFVRFGEISVPHSLGMVFIRKEEGIGTAEAAIKIGGNNITLRSGASETQNGEIISDYSVRVFLVEKSSVPKRKPKETEVLKIQDDGTITKPNGEEITAEDHTLVRTGLAGALTRIRARKTASNANSEHADEEPAPVLGPAIRSHGKVIGRADHDEQIQRDDMELKRRLQQDKG